MTVPINTFNSFEDLKEIQVEYKGRMPKYQREGSKYKGKRYMVYEQDKFSPYQNLLYKRALFGLSMYSQEELNKMHWEKRRRIKRVNKRAQEAINSLKQHVTNARVNAFFKAYFPKSQVTIQFHREEFNEIDNSLKNTLSLKDLGISKSDVVDLFVNQGILPKNFYELKESP